MPPAPVSFPKLVTVTAGSRADDVGPGKRERNKAEKQRRIVAAARELFETQGFEETTTAQISARAGIGTGTLYLYVDSKEELLVQVFRNDVGQAWDDAFNSRNRSQSVLEQLLHTYGVVSDFHSRDPALARTYFKELIFLPAEGSSSTGKMMGMYYDQMAVLLDEAQLDGKLRLDADTGVLARNFFAIWYHLMLRRYSNRMAEDEVRPTMRESFAVALLGLIPTN